MKIRDCFYLNPPKNSNNYKDYINYIDTSSVTDGKLDDVSYLTSDFPSRAQRMVQYGDILYSSVRPNLKHYYHYRDNYSHPIASSGFVLLRNKDTNLCDTEYAFYFLSTKEVVSYLSNIAELSQATFPSFSPKDLGGISLPIDDVKKQRRIASILSAYDSQIENNQKRIKLLEQMAENLYKEWFVRFRFPGYENVEKEKGLPKGWNLSPLSLYYKTSSGGTPSRSKPEYYSGDIQWIKTGELQGSFILDTEEHITKDAVAHSAAKMIPPFSLLIAMYAGTNVGNLGINVNPATCNQACCVFSSNGNYSLEYLYYFLKTQKEYLQSISFGAAQQNISQDILRKLKIVVPTEPLVSHFTKHVKVWHSSILKILEQNRLLIKQRDLLLPRLMSGKLNI